MTPHILSIGYGRHLWNADDPERARLVACAQEVPKHHMIVFSLRSHGLMEARVSETFVLHPTNSYLRAGMIVDAVWIGLRILRTSPRGTQWCISAQDPLGAGVVGYVLRWMTRHPLLVQEHGDIFSGDYWRNESRGSRVWYQIGRFILKRANRVRVVSARVREHVRQLGVKEERIVDLPVYTDIRAWIDKKPVTNLHTLHPRASCIVLSVARFVPQKNLTMLIRAFARVHALDPNAHLVLVGKGGEQWRIEYEIEKRNLESAVTLMPWSDDVASLMKTADIYALTSNYEGWARVLPEAMACGLPTVTTEVGCAGEIFLDDVHGRVVPVGDEKAFGDALVMLARDPELRKRFAENGPRDAGKLFGTIESYAPKWATTHVF